MKLAMHFPVPGVAALKVITTAGRPRVIGNQAADANVNSVRAEPVPDRGATKDLARTASRREVDQDEGAAVTDIFRYVKNQRRSYRSEVWPGCPDTPDPEGEVAEWLRRYRQPHRRGIDAVFARMVPRSRARGISPWVSLRMNDHRYTSDPTRVGPMCFERPRRRGIPSMKNGQGRLPSAGETGFMKRLAPLVFLPLLAFCPSHAAEPDTDAAPFPLTVAGLVCFWDFQDGDGRLTSKGPFRYTLEERNGTIVSVPEGVFGSALRIEHGQWLRILRRDCPALNLRGDDPVTMIAWVKRGSESPWQYIAGMWNERDSLRQYALFSCGHMQTHAKTMDRTPAKHQVHGYVSDVGGATPGKPYCFSYATGRHALETNAWAMIAFTYDRKELRVYFNGELDANEDCNPFPWDKRIFDPGEKGSDFTIAQRALPAWPGYPDRQEPTHKEGFGGLLGGLAVYKRALAAGEIRAMFDATMRDRE